MTARVHARPSHQTGHALRRTRLAALAGLGIVLLAWLALPSSARAQGAFAIRFTGTIRAGGDAVPGGTTVHVYQIRNRSLGDMVDCGTGSTGTGGTYTVDVPARAGCAVSGDATACCKYLFVVDGENVAVREIYARSPNLAQPRTLGQTERLPLTTTKLPGGPRRVTGDAVLPAARFYGRLTLGGAAARQDTPIRVYQVRKRSAGAAVDCGGGSVRDTAGGYVVDVGAQPGCAVTNDPTDCCHYMFVVAGETVGTHNIDAKSPALGAPHTLGVTYRLELHGASRPPEQDDPFDPGNGQQPSPTEAIPGNVVFDDPFDTAFQARVGDCFAQLRALGEPATALLSRLTSPTALGHTLRISQWPAPRNETQAADGGGRLGPDGSAGPGTDVTLRVNLDEQPPYRDGTPRDPCGGLVHELGHAAALLNGVEDRTLVWQPDSLLLGLPGGWLSVAELRAVTVENYYRIRQGLLPRTTYCFNQPGDPSGTCRDVPLPPQVIFPTGQDILALFGG